VSDLEAIIFTVALIGAAVILPIVLIYVGIMRKWRASVALSPAMRKKVGEIAAAHFKDPLAGRIEWIPLRYGGSPQRAYNLVRNGPQRLEFRMRSNLPPSKKLLIGAALGLLIGLVEVLSEGADLEEMFPAFLMFLGFIGFIGLLVFWFFYRRAFDLGLGLFWSTFFRLGPCPKVVFGTAPGRRRRTPRCARIADIHSLQIIGEKVEEPQQRKGLLGGFKKPPPYEFQSYELNLILRNGLRVNVVDQGDLKSLRSGARELSTFLGIPVWDSTGEWPEAADPVATRERDDPASSYKQRVLFLLDQSLRAAGDAVFKRGAEEDRCREALGWLEKFLITQRGADSDPGTPVASSEIGEAIQHLKGGRPEVARDLLRRVRTQLEGSFKGL
jgi:hypothetical protein